MRCAPGYRHNDSTGLIIGKPNKHQDSAPQWAHRRVQGCSSGRSTSVACRAAHPYEFIAHAGVICRLPMDQALDLGPFWASAGGGRAPAAVTSWPIDTRPWPASDTSGAR